MPQPDDTIITLMSDLSACLCAELATMAGTEDPPTCFCTPIPGSFPGQAYMGQGEDIAWVRLADMFPSNTPAQQNNVPLAMVAASTLIVEMGVMRCFSPNRDGSWSQEELHDLWLIQMRDLGAMQRAIQCCTGRSWDDNQVVVVNYVPVGPEGDVVGGRIPLAVQ